MRSRLSDVELSPDAFAAVMATGIVSVAALDHHHRWISIALAAVAVLTLLVMVGLLCLNAVVHQRLPFDLRDPDTVVRLFTFVAACAVLGARFEAWPAAIWTMAAIAWLAWVTLTPLAFRAMRPYRSTGLRDRAHGAWELVSVATSGLAIVTAHLAVRGLAIATLAGDRLHHADRRSPFLSDYSTPCAGSTWPRGCWPPYGFRR